MKTTPLFGFLAVLTPIIAQPHKHRGSGYGTSAGESSYLPSSTGSVEGIPSSCGATYGGGNNANSNGGGSGTSTQAAQQTDSGDTGNGPVSQSVGGGTPSASAGIPTSSSGVTGSGGTVPNASKCEHKNGIPIGWLPNNGKISSLTSQLGSLPACFDGQYAQITSTGTYKDSKSQLLGHLNDLSGDTTIFIASIMPTIPMAEVDSTVANGVVDVLKQFTAKGIQVWLRYAHEMNYYTTSGSQGGHYTGTAADFQKSWAIMSTATENTGIKMFWSPNTASVADIEPWYPTSGRVDMVGLDYYAKSGSTFESAYGAFCRKWSSASVPFVIGETGAGSDVAAAWAKELVGDGAKTACPYYAGFSWFEYSGFEIVPGVARGAFTPFDG